MAIKLIDNPKKWHCTSIDGLPATAPEGSTVHYVDTGEQYIYFDGTWEPDKRLIYAISQGMGV